MRKTQFVDTKNPPEYVGYIICNMLEFGYILTDTYYQRQLF